MSVMTKPAGTKSVTFFVIGDDGREWGPNYLDVPMACQRERAQESCDEEMRDGLEFPFARSQAQIHEIEGEDDDNETKT